MKNSIHFQPFTRAEDQDLIFQRKIKGRMPTYTYICKKCSHQFDIEQKITAESLKDCPKCSAPELKKKLYPVGIAFKGPGFYSNDYKF